MSQVLTYKCPSCGGYLVFDPASQSFQCPYCHQQYTAQEMEAQEEAQQQETTQQKPRGGSLRGYHCKMCGAEIVTDATTAATRCYYCHSPVVLTDRLSDAFEPDGVIPFQLDKEAAEKEFLAYIKKKHFVRKEFFSQSQMEDFSGVYYPYWTCDIEGEGTFEGDGTKVSVRNTHKETITITRFFKVYRSGLLTFRQMIRKALNKADSKLSEGIHPYQMEDVKPYESSYLSGFLAEKRDIPQRQAEESMLEEARKYTTQMFINADNPYNSLHGHSTFTPKQVKTKYLLLPAWVLTYKHRADGEPYYYMMNGQTGRICGKLPIDWGKLCTVSGLIAAGVFAVLCLGGALLW